MDFFSATPPCSIPLASYTHNRVPSRGPMVFESKSGPIHLAAGFGNTFILNHLIIYCFLLELAMKDTSHPKDN